MTNQFLNHRENAHFKSEDIKELSEAKPMDDATKYWKIWHSKAMHSAIDEMKYDARMIEVNQKKIMKYLIRIISNART